MTQPASAHPLVRDVRRGPDSAGEGGPARPRSGGDERYDDGAGRTTTGTASRVVRGVATRIIPSAGPFLLYLLLAAAILWPYRTSKFRPAGDLNVVVGTIVEARNALAEGQFPIRVAPRQHDGARYPLFQFYANFPYTLTGALTLAGLSPYAAWRLVMLAALTCGGFFVYRTGRYLTRDPLAAAAGGVAFVAAPYMLIDLHARGAFGELVAFNLLPLALYACLRCLASRRRGWRYVPLAAIAWALIGLTHNITYLYGVILVGLLLVTMLGFNRRGLRRFGRLAAAGALHAAMMLWYVVPQIQLLSRIEMHGQTGSPFSPGGLTSLATLLAPRLSNAPGSTTPNLGLQIGWPVLAGALLVLLGVSLLWRRAPRRLRRIGLRLLAAFALAFFVVWSPVNFWQYVPKPFWFVQFTYRLIVFTTLFGALLVAVALAIWTRPLAGHGIARRAAMFVTIALAAAAAASYMPRGGKLERTFVRQQLANPTAGGPFDYLLAPTATVVNGATFAHPGVDLARPEFGLAREGPWLREGGGATLRMTPVEGARGLNVRGESPDGPARLHVQVGGRRFVVRVARGAFEFSLWLPKCFCSDAPMLGFHPLDEQGRGPARVVLESVRYEGAPEPEHVLVTADEIRAQLRRDGAVAKLRYETDRPVLLQLPLLYYPGMLRVTDHGEPVPFGNVGRLLAVQLPAGKHRLAVQFTGVRWANAASGLAWSGVILVPLAILRNRRRRRRMNHHATTVAYVTQRTARAAALPVRDAALACCAIAAGAGVALGGTWLADRLGDPDAVRITCDTVAAGAQFEVANAFDGKLDSTWATKGWVTTPPKVTITRERSRPLREIVLVARETVLMETWHTVHVSASLDGWQVFDRVFQLPAASSKRTIRLDIDAPAVDRVEMTFSDPVVTFPVPDSNADRGLGPGAARAPVSRDVVNPGYSEIQLDWTGVKNDS